VKQGAAPHTLLAQHHHQWHAEEQQHAQTGNDHPHDCRSAVLATHQADEAQDERRRREDEETQPAKGCNRRPSPRLNQQEKQDHQRRKE